MFIVTVGESSIKNRMTSAWGKVENERVKTMGDFILKITYVDDFN